jgi:hypothetical protein
MTLPAWLTRIHHGYLGLILAGIGLFLEVNTWDAQGNYRTIIPFQDVFGWLFAGAGIGLFGSDLLEHFISKEKHSGEMDKITKTLPDTPQRPPTPQPKSYRIIEEAKK